MSTNPTANQELILRESPSLRLWPAFDSSGLDRTREPAPALLIIPGGAYKIVAKETEGFPTAEFFTAAGFRCFVLTSYSLGSEARMKNVQADTALAVAAIRARAGEWHLRPDRIAVMGFSAGGHMAMMLGTSWTRDECFEGLGLTAEQRRPDALVLCYPYLGNYATVEWMHKLAAKLPQLQNRPVPKTPVGEPVRVPFDPDFRAWRPEQVFGVKHEDWQKLTDALFALPPEAQPQVGRMFFDSEPGLETLAELNPLVPPTFVWHCRADHIVPCIQSQALGEGLKYWSVPHEAHFYPEGAHAIGIGLTENAGEARHWPTACLRWFRELWGLGS